MKIKIAIILAISLYLAISSYSLLLMSALPYDEIDPPFKYRFLCLGCLNALMFLSTLSMLPLIKIYSHILLIFLNCLVTSLTVTICERLVASL
jgi:hypothetical protein